jgi:hypothetical protein
MIYKFNQKKNNLRLGCSFFKKIKEKVLLFFLDHDILIHVLSERMKQMSSTRRQKVKNR